MPIEFTFDVQPDENGIFDGRELARKFIGSAYHLLVPYVSACPACADNLFSAIANAIIEELHQEGRERASWKDLSCQHAPARSATRAKWRILPPPETPRLNYCARQARRMSTNSASGFRFP